jgi:hypothetical protein
LDKQKPVDATGAWRLLELSENRGVGRSQAMFAKYNSAEIDTKKPLLATGM